MDPASSAPVSRSRRPSRSARGRMIRIRVSDEEYAALSEKGAAAGGMSKLLRDHLGQIWIRHRDDERQRLAMLNRINANLNMVARWANTFKERADAWAVVSRLEAIQAELSALLAAWEGKTDDRRVFGVRHRQR